MKIKKGFTLIETLVVIAVISITLPVLISIILILMRQQLRIYRLAQVKKEGDYLISIMETTIKDEAVSIHSGQPASESNIVCSDPLIPHSPTSSLYFLDKNNNWFGYEFGGDSIASSSSLVSNNLTSSKILVQSFSITCSKNKIYSSPSIIFSFDVCYDNAGAGSCNSTRPEEQVSIHYQTRIKLRNY